MSFQKDFLSKKITDPLAKIVSDLSKQEYQQTFQTQNIDTLNVQVLSIKTKTKTLSKDKFHISVKSYDPDQRFYNAVYPDRNKMKLWIKAENSDKLHDYSLTNHNAHLWSEYQVAEQYTRDDENNMAGHEIVSHANGTHYIHVQDRRDLRISDLIVDEPSNNGFTVIERFNPLTRGTNKQDSVIIDQKIDSSQNRYGHSINVDDEGNIYFYVAYNYRLYWCKLDSPFIIPSNMGDYRSDNYNPKNYQTDVDTLSGAIDINYDLVCQFNYTTKECIIKVVHDGVITHVSSSLTGTNALPSNLQLHLPLQEGKWSETKTLPNNLPMNQVYDASTNQLIGTVLNSGNSGQWNDNNTFTNSYLVSGGTFFEIPNHSSMNNLTEFTFSTWIKKSTTVNNGGVYNIFTKGQWTSGDGALEIGYDEINNMFYFAIFPAGVYYQLNFTNPMPNVNEYVFVTAKWKSGEKMKLSVNNIEVQHASNVTGNMPVINPVWIHGNKTTDLTFLNMMFFNRQITSTEQTLLFNYGPHLAQFPTNLEPQRLVNPNPPLVTNPVSTIYDLPPLVSPTINDYTFINNPSTQNPFIEKYNCPDGVAGGTPVSTIYNIAPGTGGTTVNPFVTIYDLPKPGSPSTGQIVYSSTASNNEWGYVQYVRDPLSLFVGKKATEIKLWLNGADNPTGGLVWLGIIKNDGTKIKFGTSIDPTTIPDAWTAYTMQLLTNSYALAVGDGIGVIWENGTGGAVNVHRGGQGVHFESNAYSCQNGRRGAGIGEWKTPNPDYSMAATIKTGGDTTGTSPYYALKNVSGSNYLAGEIFPLNSPAIGQTPTHVEFRVYRDTAANNGTVSIRHVKADGTYWNTLYEVNVSTLPDQTAIPTTFNFVWDNVDYNKAIIANDRIAVVTNGLTTGNIYVLSNIGNSGVGNSYDTTRSFINFRSFAGTFSSNTAIDMSGVIKVGGSTFVPFLKFSPAVTRIYERAINTSSIFYDQPLSRVIARGKRTGTIPQPSMMTCRLRSSANVEKAVLGTYDANSVGTSLSDATFTNNNNNVKVAVGDYVSIEIDTCDASNYIELSISNVAYDGVNSLLGKMESGVIGDLAFDLSGKFYIGGQIDNTSRPRVSQYIDTQDSIFLTVPNNRVTIFEATLVAVGAPTGLIYINIRRGFDDALIFSLGSISAGGITTALTGTKIHIENFNNTYILSAKDKISIEYEGGSPINKIGVQIKTNTNYDGANSYVARYNGIEYDYLSSSDLVAKMQVGGDTYQPDPNAPPPVLPQNPTDLYILSGINKKQSSFMRCIFGMYLFFNTILTDQELINFNYTRIDTGNNSPDSIQVTNHSFFRNS
jgi:hypothetical protein